MPSLRLSLAAAGAALFLPLAAQAYDGPPAGARPGECYGQVILPAVYGPATRSVLEQRAWTEEVPGAAVVERVKKRVLVKPARTVKVRTAAVYRDEVSWVERPARQRWVTQPAKYRTVKTKVLIEPGHAEWRRVDAPLAYGESSYGQTMVQPTGEVVCRVWVPARYGFTTKKVLVAKAKRYQVTRAAQRQKVVRKVLVREGALVERRRPAVYRTVVTEKLVREGAPKLIEHPAVYRKVEQTVQLKPEREGWARVLCGGAINPAFMAQVQQALIAQGFDAGPPDGYGRAQTYAALRMFQRQRGLAQGQLTWESARALGVL
jgi:hypothetical protein